MKVPTKKSNNTKPIKSARSIIIKTANRIYHDPLKSIYYQYSVQF